MPRGDRTGPQGQGPMTGRGRGKGNPKDRSSLLRGQGGMGSDRKADRNRGQGSGRRAGRGQVKGRSRRS
jgi:hypothetical protein